MMKAGAIKKYRRITCEAVEAEQIETMPWAHVTVQAAFFYADKRRRDQDNAMGALKSAYDGIVDSGLVADDDYEHMERGAPTFSIDPKSPRVEITITRQENR
jgi:Holliday junction resolvase RusA-like endonuclease